MMQQFPSWVVLILIAAAIAAAQPPASSVQPVLRISPGNALYTVDPAKGEDMGKIDAIRLAPGDRVVIKPGVYHESLVLHAVGTRERPVVVEFSPGRVELRADRAIRRCYFVSNSADAPLEPRPIGILLKDCRHVQLTGGKAAEIVYGDRMTYFINDHSQDITWSGLSFDMVRPTVSEFRVLDSAPGWSVIQIAEGSSYQFKNGKLAWTGDLGSGGVMVQQATLADGRCWRVGINWNPFALAQSLEDLGAGKFKLIFKNNYRLQAGSQFQFRCIRRDNTSAVNTRCKDIVIRDCNFHSLPGMGLVSQFTTNITYERVNVVPPPGTIRTCPAWADCFHFSGCRGDVVVNSCRFSGTQDDAINIHGTHLRLIQKTGSRRVLVRFMQPQTYGIAAFEPGDRVEFINHQTLRGYAANTVTALERKTDKDWLLTLANPVADFGKDDVVDNLTWYPDVTIRNCTVAMDSCRGFLITTRGKAIIEGCTFTRTHMSAILVEDDAEGWFESGPIRDLTLRGNHFIQCGNPVVWVHPHNHNNDPALPVHQNIRIENNIFDGGGISATSVQGLTVVGNRFTGRVAVNTAACTQVKIESNVQQSKP